MNLPAEQSSGIAVVPPVYKPNKEQQEKLKDRMKPYEISDNLPVGGARYVISRKPKTRL